MVTVGSFVGGSAESNVMRHRLPELGIDRVADRYGSLPRRSPARNIRHAPRLFSSRESAAMKFAAENSPPSQQAFPDCLQLLWRVEYVGENLTYKETSRSIDPCQLVSLCAFLLAHW
ncbi:hypothetical protein Agau_C201660 [Agrobacterium tumefaciens F2]|nr:hypothetical protein Agau_C201660 [Agrobacterium tumefaciens F2]